MLTVDTKALQVVPPNTTCDPMAGEAPAGFQRVWVPDRTGNGKGYMALQALRNGEVAKPAKPEVYKGELFAWIDVETTGLDPEADIILEYGLIVTDADLNEIVREVQVVKYHPGIVDRYLNRGDRPQAQNEALIRMHTESGLLADLKNAYVTSDDLDDHFLEYMLAAAGRHEENTGRKVLVGATGDSVERRAHFEGEQRPIMAGCTPWLDRSMTKVYLPNLYANLSRWTLDATCLKIAFETWGGHELKKREKIVQADPMYRRHRALGDLLDALDLARRCRKLVQSTTGFDPLREAAHAAPR